jgi:hypothetical protein
MFSNVYTLAPQSLDCSFSMYSGFSISRFLDFFTSTEKTEPWILFLLAI